MLKQAIIFTFIAIIANYNCSAMNNNPEFLPNEEVLIQTNDESYDQGIVKRLCSKLHCTHAANGDNLKPICEDVDQEDYDCSELECFQDSIGTIMCQNCQDSIFGSLGE